MSGHEGLEPRIFMVGILSQMIKSLRNLRIPAKSDKPGVKNRRGRIQSSRLRDIPVINFGGEEGEREGENKGRSKKVERL